MPFTFFTMHIVGAQTPVKTIDPTPCTELPPTLSLGHSASLSQNSCATPARSLELLLQELPWQRALAQRPPYSALTHQHKKSALERILIICLTPSALCSNCKPWFWQTNKASHHKKLKNSNKSVRQLNVDYARYYLGEGGAIWRPWDFAKT